MKTFNIEVSGDSLSEVLNGIEEARRRIERGFGRGADSNDDCCFSFQSNGEYSETSICPQCGSDNVRAYTNTDPDETGYECLDCKH